MPPMSGKPGLPTTYQPGKPSRFTPRVIAVLLIQLFIFLLWTFLWMAESERQALLDELENSLTERVDLAYSLVTSSHGAAGNELGENTLAQANAQLNITNMRSGDQGQGVFWVVDTSGMMIVNPLRPNLVGTNVSDIQDQRGKPFMAELLRNAPQFNEGFFEYHWQWSGSGGFPKRTAYYRYFEPWGWVIVSDFMPGSIGSWFGRRGGEQLLVLFLLTSALLFVITTTLRRMVLSGVDRMVEAAGKMQQGDLSARVKVGAADEMANLAQAFNLMAEGIQHRNIQVRQAQRASVFALASLASTRDEETGGHLLRVREYSTALAKEMRKDPRWAKVIDRRFISDLFEATLLHDIGKVALPDSILLKPDNLTDDETQVMRGHTTIGADTIKTAAKQMKVHSTFLDMAELIARCHHERWNGEGYPNGLKGDGIPLAARIFTVADVYDALTTERPYKHAYSHAEAIESMIPERNERFDPEIFDEFMATGKQFAKIRQEFADRASGHQPE